MTVSSNPIQHDPDRLDERADQAAASEQTTQVSDATSYDVIVAGSGGGGLAAALTAADAGLSVLVIEGAPFWGGSTAMSGGGLWLPNNPLMQRAGVGDSREDALAYLDETVGDEGPATSRARKEAFVDNVGGFIDLTERHGITWARSADYPDYYPERRGGKIGRALEVEPFDTRKLGDRKKTLNPGGLGAPVKTDDFWLLSRAWSTPGGVIRGARVVGRTLGSLVQGKRLAGMGPGLASALMWVCDSLGVTLWLDAPVLDLLQSDGRVTGVRTTQDGREVEVTARRGVVLATGGFDHNAELRERHQQVDGRDSSGSPNNLGGGHQAAERAGAALALMDDAWWGGSIPATDSTGPAFLVSERSMPHSIIVDAAGRRFANESESYVDLGHHMREHAAETPGRFWMITDVRHSRRYLRSFALDPRGVKAMKAAGIWHTAPTMDALAGAIGVPADALRATVERFNGFAASGMDQDFARGNSAYDRYYGDPLCRPNPNLGSLEKDPFTAIEIVPGDLGTKGGVLTDEHARALREDGSVIDGLYAVGNASASVMGRTYPGPGSTIGPATVFGYIAARHLAGTTQ